ncbi:MAG: hypothetical protein U0235_27055 [Polyangiaceae bacterium]
MTTKRIATAASSASSGMESAPSAKTGNAPICTMSAMAAIASAIFFRLGSTAAGSRREARATAASSGVRFTTENLRTLLAARKPARLRIANAAETQRTRHFTNA